MPATQFGRIACICFALFGIPLLLVTIADIGKFLSDFLSFLYRTYRTFKRKVRDICVINKLIKLKLTSSCFIKFNLLISKSVHFRRFLKLQVCKQSRRISHHYRDRSSSAQSSSVSTKAGSMNLNSIGSDSESSCEVFFLFIK